MRTVTALFAATAAAFAAACGSKAPVVCGDAIPQQEVFATESKTVTVCFEDPGGGELNYSIATSDELVVRAFMRGEAAGITGVAPGQATVSVTATNEADQSVTVDFKVLVPNRAPIFVSTITEAQVGWKQTLLWDLSGFFEEPDGEDMTFAAMSSNSGAIDVRVDDSIATVSGVSEGSAQITLTATDPHGLEGKGTVNVTLVPPVFEDDFDSEASFDNWLINDTVTTAKIANGYLTLTPDSAGYLGAAYRDLGGNAVDWVIAAALRTDDEGAGVGFRVFPNSTTVRYFDLRLGEYDYGGIVGMANYILYWSQGNQLFVDPDWSFGISSLIDDLQEMEIVLSITAANGIRATIDGQLLFEDEEFALNQIGSFFLATFPEASPGESSSTNWIRVFADEFTASDINTQPYYLWQGKPGYLWQGKPGRLLDPLKLKLSEPSFGKQEALRFGEILKE